MKKLLFIIAFAFIGHQAYSQMYIVSILYDDVNSCGNYEYTLATISPSGVLTKTCITNGLQNSTTLTNGLIAINLELNSIMSQGYKLIHTDTPGDDNVNGGVLNVGGATIKAGTIYYLALPWTSSGLEEVATTLKSFIISPNPANTFVDISLDYSLKGKNEVLFISEAGYISHKQSIGNISKNEKYNIDISKIPAGKYLVTIVNGKTYTTPQKLIIF